MSGLESAGVKFPRATQLETARKQEGNSLKAFCVKKLFTGNPGPTGGLGKSGVLEKKL